MNKIISRITSVALLGTMLTYTVPVFAYTKEETVYSKMNQNGEIYNTIVNSHIKNEEALQTINDISDLLNIENIVGNEKFTQNENQLVWDASGSDIYYQGNTNKELPIECKVKYELNGEEIEAKDIAGKSGKIKITIEYVNKDKHEEKIYGKTENLYTPFVVVCGAVVENENNKNIEITNGKKIDDGTKTILVGISMPGLGESLGISEDKLEIPSKVEISMESTDFELGNIITYVTPKVIENYNELLDEINKLYSKVNTLETSSKQIEDGANTLKDGVTTYSEKSQEFNSAMKQVSSGVSSANKNYEQINSGIGKLNESSKTLQTGAKEIADGTKLVSTNIATVSEKLQELKAGTKELEQGEKSIKDGLDKILVAINQIETQDNTAKIKELEQLIATNESTIKTLNASISKLKEQSEIVKDETQLTTIKAQMQTNQNIIKLLEANQKANKEILVTLKKTDASTIKQLQDGLKSVSEAMKQLQTGTNKLYNGATELSNGAKTLDAKTKELATGAEKLYAGTVQLTAGTKDLSTGSNQMKQGLSSLDTGAKELTKANDQLTQGTSTIKNGATSLAEGIQKFNSEGVQKICNYINGDVKKVTKRLEKLEELSNEYNNFTMIDGKNEGSVKFIMIMDSIKQNEQVKEEAILQDKKEN